MVGQMNQRIDISYTQNIPVLFSEGMDFSNPSTKWFYRGEGNATLVISNPETRKVLRLRKKGVNSNTSSKHPEKSESNQQELTRSADFCTEIFVSLLGEKYVHPGVVVDVPKEFLTGIKNLITSVNKERPSHRLTKEVTSECQSGVLMPDFCFTSDCFQDGLTEFSSNKPTFCVEIKPKCGTLPTCDANDAQSSIYNQVKRSVCKYCLYQWHKVNKQGKYPRRSGYCPLDLFSMEPERVLYALTGLLHDPQNNLRIFQNGALVYCGDSDLPPSSYLAGKAPPMDKSESVNGLSPAQNRLVMLEDILRSSFGNSTYQTPPNKQHPGKLDGIRYDHITLFLVTLLQLLVHDSKVSTSDDNRHIASSPICAGSNYKARTSMTNDIQLFLKSSGITFAKAGVLNRILDTQKLDQLGSDEVFKIYEHLCKHSSSNDCLSDLFHTNTFPLNYNVGSSGEEVIKHVSLKYFHKNVSPPGTSHASKEDKSSLSSQLTDTARFLIAASANDCSIMISFQQVDTVPSSSTAHYFEEAITGLYYKYSIAVVDLDPKLIDRIPKYYHEYHEIINNYLQYSANVLN